MNPRKRTLHQTLFCAIVVFFLNNTYAGSIGFAGPIQLIYTQAGVEITKGFSTIQAAINAGALLVPSGILPTVFVPSGTYAEKITMKQNVNLQGAGANTTKISCLCGGTLLDASSATLIAADNASVKNIRIRNSGGGDFAIAVYSEGSVSFRLEDVDIVAGPSGIESRGIYATSLGARQQLDIKDSIISVSGDMDATAVYVEGIGAHLFITNSEILVVIAGRYAYGVTLVNNGEVDIRRSKIIALANNSGTDAYGINNRSGNVTLYYSEVIARDATMFSIAIFNDATVNASYNLLTGGEYTIYHAATPFSGNYGYNQFTKSALGKYTNSPAYGESGTDFNCLGNHDPAMAATSC